MQKEGFIRKYMHSGEKSLFRTIKREGVENVIPVILEEVEKKISFNINEFERDISLRTSLRNNAPSTPEIITGIALSNSKISFCWDFLRVFSDNKAKTHKSIFPDFITNVMIGDKLLAVEFHSMKMLFNGLKDKFKADTVKKEVEQWTGGTVNSNLYVLFISDFKYETFTNVFNVDPLSFSDICVTYPKMSMISRDNRSERQIPPHVQKIEEPKRYLLEEFKKIDIFMKNGDKSVKYFNALSLILNNLLNDQKVKKLNKEAFHKILEIYIRTVIESRLLSNEDYLIDNLENY